MGMKPDKVFILLLVILLPLTGCIDVSDNADAQDSSDTEEAETTVINNYYNNTTVVESIGFEVITHYIPPNGNLTLSFDGTYTYKLETAMRNTTGGSSVSSWRADGWLSSIDMTCGGTKIVDGLATPAGVFLPVLPNQICIIEIDRTGGTGDIVSFTKHPLA